MDVIDRLVEKGVIIYNPRSVWISDEVDEKRIAPGVVIHSGCRIMGEKTLLLEGAKLGAEAPATVDNCYVGPDAELKGGFYKGAVFLEGASMGSGAHVREGTILEEGASGAHTVGLKQTILFPFVTLGSLINFCDCFMSGGTSRKDHSEVGSSYIHFNYTPNQDKATASLLGDVPRGVMLDQPPIFLGGQGGLVGPCRIEFGNIVAAGSVYRKDTLESGQLLIGAPGRGGSVPFRRGGYPGISRIVTNNILYIANLLTLMAWYRKVRQVFVSERFPSCLLEGLRETLSANIKERIDRLEAFFLNAEKTASHPLIKASRDIIERLREMESDAPSEGASMVNFLEGLENLRKNNETAYIPAIKGMSAGLRAIGTRWLQTIVGRVVHRAFETIPEMKPADIE